MQTKIKTLLLLLTLALPLLFVQGVAAWETEDCLGCHEDVDTVGDDLIISGETFGATAHAEMGCVSCHEVSEEHPDDGAEVVKAGCADCHDAVEAEYAASVHGDYASCNDCHDPHDAWSTAKVSGHDMNQQCANCHDRDEMGTLHEQWLPQSKLHMESLPCIACHTGSEDYVVTLYLAKSDKPNVGTLVDMAGYDELSKLAGGSDLVSLLDTNGDGTISIEELYAFNRNPDFKSLTLHGMMTPEEVTHSFQILDNRWDCSYCHASGPEAMQTSYVAFPKQDGTFKRVSVERGAVLDALYGTPDFYIMGSTRNSILNIIGLLLILCGVGFAFGHGTLRFLTRKNRIGKGH